MELETTKMTGPEGEEALVNSYEVDIWKAKGWKVAIDKKETSTETKPEAEPVSPEEYLSTWKMPHLRRLAGDLNISEANLLSKTKLIAEIIEAGWKPPVVEADKEEG